MAPSTWKIEWLLIAAEGKRRIPAAEFLAGIDDGVKVRLLQIVDSVVATGGPHKWQDTTTHDKMEGRWRISTRPVSGKVKRSIAST